MKTEKEMRSGSKWRRSLMAVAVLSAPVVSISGFSGGASAGSVINYEVTWDCTEDFDEVIQVQINTNANAKISIYIRPDSAAAWGNNFDFRVVGNADYDDESPFTFINDGSSTPIAAGAYDVKIVDGNGKGNASPLYETTVSVGGCVAISFPNDVDDFVSVYCAYDPAQILVTLPQRDPPTAKGPKYTVYVYEDEAKGFDDEATNLDQGGSAVFDTGEGVFEIEIWLPGDSEPVYSNTIEVDCSNGGGGGGGYNFNFKLPATTKPTLPSTGSDSSTSLLVIAPVMMLLGAGLIAARRRLATV